MEHALLPRDYGQPVTDDLELVSNPGYLAATLPVWSLAAGSVAAYAGAANRFRGAREIPARQHTIAPDAIAASFMGDRLLRVNGEAMPGFAELSGFFPTADGYVRTHANYDHHRSRLLDVLGLPSDASRDSAAARIRELEAAELEDKAAEQGAIAVRVRTETEWSASEPGIAVARLPMVASAIRDDEGPTGAHGFATTLRPLAGMRVLDLTRVLAGPVATRSLALLGAEVLRVDAPTMPEIAAQHLDTGQGKSSALLDITVDVGEYRELLRFADILITGYRPGCSAASGELAVSARPGIIHGQVSAWGTAGPWAHRRGFDSVVQAATGISLIESADGVTPGALPAQALDHATGYLLAAGVLDALAARAADGRGRDVQVSLARTATWLLQAPGRSPDHGDPLEPGPENLIETGGVVTARPALAEYPEYPWPAHPHGTSAPAWEL